MSYEWWGMSYEWWVLKYKLWKYILHIEAMASFGLESLVGDYTLRM